jgi:hypothetical protein
VKDKEEEEAMVLSRRAFALLASAVVGVSLATNLPALGEDGMVVTFTSGTALRGSVTVTNAVTGATISSALAENSTPSACANTLSLTAPKVGLRTELSGNSVRIYGHGNAVTVIGATLTESDFTTQTKSKADCEACCTYHRNEGKARCSDDACRSGVENFFRDNCLPKCGNDPNSCK